MPEPELALLVDPPRPALPHRAAIWHLHQVVSKAQCACHALPAAIRPSNHAACSRTWVQVHGESTVDGCVGLMRLA